MCFWAHYSYITAPEAYSRESAGGPVALSSSADTNLFANSKLVTVGHIGRKRNICALCKLE